MMVDFHEESVLFFILDVMGFDEMSIMKGDWARDTEYQF